MKNVLPISFSRAIKRITITGKTRENGSRSQQRPSLSFQKSPRNFLSSFKVKHCPGVHERTKSREFGSILKEQKFEYLQRICSSTRSYLPALYGWKINSLPTTIGRIATTYHIVDITLEHIKLFICAHNVGRLVQYSNYRNHSGCRTTLHEHLCFVELGVP